MATENFWLFSRLKALRLALEGLRDEIKSQFNLSEGGRWLIVGYQLGVDDPQGQGRQTHYGQSSPERRDGDPGSHRLRRPRLNLDGRRKLHSSRVVALEGHNLAEDEVFDKKELERDFARFRQTWTLNLWAQRATTTPTNVTVMRWQINRSRMAWMLVWSF